VAAGFWAALTAYAAERKAKILVVPTLYRNPTAKRSKATRDRENRYAPEVLPFLVNRRAKLAPGLALMGDVPVQPTAGNPLSGMEILAAETSAIVGHVQRQVVCVPTATRDPRVLWTTTACTVPKYGKSRAGARAKEHHSVGALVVEVERSGRFFVRHLCASKDGSFYDIDTRYTKDGAQASKGAAALVLGDIHVGHEDAGVLAASRALTEAIQPEYLVLHDVYDGHTRSHHRQGYRHAWDGRFGQVELEVMEACAALDEFSKWGAGTVAVVRSNHDEHLERWAEEFDPRKDPVNTPYWHSLMARAYADRESDGRWPDLLAMEALARCESDRLLFLGRNASLKAAGVELAFHGDKGTSGSRGSIQSFARLGCKTVIAHSHTPGWRQGCVQVGVTGKLDMGYNTLPSTWARAQCIVHPDGKRQLVFLKDGRYRGGQKKGVK
jgi:hypothetical protein